MCPLTENTRTGLPKMGLQGWKADEERILHFLDNGVDYTGEYGLTYIYVVEADGVKQSLWVKPKGPLAIGLQGIVNENKSLLGLYVKVTKTLGKKQSDTRYNAEIYTVK